MMRELLLLGWIVGAAVFMWWWQHWLNRRIQPKQLGIRFLLYAVLVLAGLLTVVVGVSWLILHFRGFFFTR